MKYIKQLLFSAALTANLFTASAGTITVKGSDTLVILAQKWAEVYMANNTDTTIQVTGGGSGTGFAALQNRTTDLANASRQIKAKEKMACIKAFKHSPKEYRVALDGLSVYVNASNSIDHLTLDQLDAIFTGKITDWNQIGGKAGKITLYSRENSSGTYEFFKKKVLKGKDFDARAQTMPGTASVIQAISKDPSGIGYGGAAYGSGAKAIKVKKDASSPAVEATEENVVSGTYPIWRYLFIYVNPALDKGEVADYLQWIQSPGGQKVVKNVGYYPLPITK
ncbi:phosphate ABC transporter substrate-binding protein [Verrucomicrobia bacterium]|nr:phosphate ABC transporter substrate-binding protein [Verrucomicrobiota bacterium]